MAKFRFSGLTFLAGGLAISGFVSAIAAVMELSSSEATAKEPRNPYASSYYQDDPYRGDTEFQHILKGGQIVRVTSLDGPYIHQGTIYLVPGDKVIVRFSWTRDGGLIPLEIIDDPTTSVYLASFRFFQRGSEKLESGKNKFLKNYRAGDEQMVFAVDSFLGGPVKYDLHISGEGFSNEYISSCPMIQNAPALDPFDKPVMQLQLSNFRIAMDDDAVCS